MTTSDAGLTSNHHENELNDTLREQLRDYVAYTITSANGLYREPHSYGPMRMIDALERSLRLIQSLGLSDSALDGSLQIVRENRWRAGTDSEGFSRALDEAILRLVDITLSGDEV